MQSGERKLPDFWRESDYLIQRELAVAIKIHF